MNRIERELGEIKNDLATHNHELLNDLSDVFARLYNVKCIDDASMTEIINARNIIRKIMKKIQG